MSRRQADDTVETILNDFYASELNCDIRSLWDGGFDVAMGDYFNGYIASKTGLRSWRQIAEWLKKMAICYYPQSEFADKYRPSGPKRDAEEARLAVGSAKHNLADEEGGR